MILTDNQIIKRLQDKELVIKPLPTNQQIQPCSLDIRLGNEFWSQIKVEGNINPKVENPKYEIIKADAIILPPNEFILATSKEWVEIPKDLSARVEGRSSIGRLGIAIHVTAGFIDAGFKGNITLEIKNLSPNNIMLHENMRIAQLVFEELTNAPTRIYGEAGNKYQNQDGVIGSLIFYDEDNKLV